MLIKSHFFPVQRKLSVLTQVISSLFMHCKLSLLSENCQVNLEVISLTGLVKRVVVCINEISCGPLQLLLTSLHNKAFVSMVKMLHPVLLTMPPRIILG